MSPDAELCQAWIGGDRRAGETLVEKHLPSIARYFANKVANAADAEELVSQTFEQCAKSLPGYRGESSFRTYLFGIAHNVLRDYLRRVGRVELEELDAASVCDLLPTPSQHLAAKREQKLLLAALRAIPLHSQVVLELSFFEELGRADIAEVLGLPPGTVASRLRRGRAQLDAKLQELAASPGELQTTLRGLEGWMNSIARAVGER